MKRVFLVAPGTRLSDDEGHLIANASLVRAAAAALADFAVNGDSGRNVGDPVHEWVTEGRRKQYEDALAAGAEWAVKLSKTGGYSDCGDLAHWVLMCLGCRDERYVNRTDDGGSHPWMSGLNITRLCELPAYIDAKAAHGRIPAQGDILHVAAPDHVDVVQQWDVDGARVLTSDYGQPYGRSRVHALVQRGSVTMVGSRVLMGWVDITQVELAESAVVPNDFDGGTDDDNPYAEAMQIPANVP